VILYDDIKLVCLKMFYDSNVILHNLAVECRKSLAAIADCYIMTIYNIVLCNNLLCFAELWKFVRPKLKIVWFVSKLMVLVGLCCNFLYCCFVYFYFYLGLFYVIWFILYMCCQLA